MCTLVRMKSVEATPATARTTEHTTAAMAVVCTAPRILAMSSWPICTAITTFTPTESPTNSATNRLMMGATPPTAASALLPSHWPANMASVEFSSCCRILVMASGMENRMILPAKGPCSMSMLFDFLARAAAT